MMDCKSCLQIFHYRQLVPLASVKAPVQIWCPVWSYVLILGLVEFVIQGTFFVSFCLLVFLTFSIFLFNLISLYPVNLWCYRALALSPDYNPLLACDLAPPCQGGRRKHLESKKRWARENIRVSQTWRLGANDEKAGHGPEEKGVRSGRSSRTNWQGGEGRPTRSLWKWELYVIFF